MSVRRFLSLVNMCILDNLPCLLLCVFSTQISFAKSCLFLAKRRRSKVQLVSDWMALQHFLQELSGQAAELDIKLLDKKVDQMMPELGFTSDDNDRLVASYSGGWQMRMCLGKILLQEPDLLLLDEPTNHLDLDALEWLEGMFWPGDISLQCLKSNERAPLPTAENTHESG